MKNDDLIQPDEVVIDKDHPDVWNLRIKNKSLGRPPEVDLMLSILHESLKKSSSECDKQDSQPDPSTPTEQQ